MEKNYSKREIDSQIGNLTKTITDYHTETVTSINLLTEQVKKTNGSVGSLKAWRTGIGMVVGVIAFIVIPLVIYSFNLSQENLKTTILLEMKNQNDASINNIKGMMVPIIDQKVGETLRDIQIEVQ